MEVSKCLVENIHCAFSGGLHFTAPIASLRTNEVDLVRGVLQILQGLSSSLFYWDQTGRCFCAKKGIYVTHLSLTSLHAVLNQFTYAATCLRLVEIIVNKLKNAGSFSPPTLRAFACSVSAWLTRLRDIALKEEVNICSSDGKFVPTLLGLASSLSSICSGAEYLLQMVHGAIPQVYLEREPPVMASDIAVHILNYLYKKLNEVSLVQGGEEDAYWMLLYIFVGSLLPYIEVLDSWLFEGTLDDPFEEMFFYANKGIAIDEAEFWERSYLLKQTEYHKLDATPRESLSLSGSAKDAENGRDLKVCPLFLKDIAMAIISAGKSLQLIRHSPTFSTISCNKNEVRHGIAGLTFSEVFCVSLAALVGHGDHISEHIWRGDGIISSSRSVADKQTQNNENLPPKTCSEKIWYKYLVDIDTVQKRGDDFIGMRTNLGADAMHEVPLVKSLFPENPAITVCQRFLHDYKDAWKSLNLSMNFCLPPLNDVDLRQAVFGKKTGNLSVDRGTDYTYGFLFGESEHLSSHGDAEMLEKLFPFPTLLPPFKEDHRMSEFLPFQKNSTIPSRVLNSIISVEPKATPLPVVILQECLIVHIKKQVDYIGRNILSKLLNDWRLMDELGVLRAIYLLGSGDLLQHFLTVIFNKLDKGESWDDEFELNTILQESIRNSADGMLLSADDSLIVSISKSHGFSGDEQHNPSILVSTPRKGRAQFGIDVLDSLKFTYKVSWPLELIANTEAIKKYNKVMSFLLKVKRAKFVLDKVRRWMWKDRSTMTINRKRHWLVEQKLLHFVDAFHQYVMDRVYHSAWRELCEGMAAAGSLDQVIEVHEAYLLSIQRQCFAVPDKLWALIASRINSILRLALDFYSIQQTLCGGVISAVKARCEMEVDRIDKQFDDCIAFLLRVLSFKLNVGQFPHLADLVTRINYNYFYMSDSGNLITAPGSDTVPVASSKLGKAFPVRKD